MTALTLPLALLLATAGCAPDTVSVTAIDSTRVSPALLALYAEHRAATDASRAPVTDLMVRDGAVRIEAMAAASGADLLARLADIGLVEGVYFGVVVNGLLPVAAIPRASHLEDLRYLDAVIRPPQTPVEPPDRP
jgi:hypothetical protein